MSEPETHIDRIDLAAEPDFVLGRLELMPSRCRAGANGLEEKVEPRVMQVVVALAKAAGRTITRDRLIEVCWEGRAISDDAVARAVAKARQLGGDHFTIETVPRVGFRLVAAKNAAPARTTTAEATPPRRGWIRVAAALAVAAAIVTAGAWAIFGGARQALTDRLAIAVTADSDAPGVARLAKDTKDALARAFAAAGIPVIDEARDDGTARFALTAAARKPDGYAVRAAVTDLASGVIVWSGELARPAADVQGFDQEVAHALAGLFVCAMDERRAARTPMSTEVLSLFAYACDTLLRTGRGLDTARRLVEKAPGMAGAHALLAVLLAEHAGDIDTMKQDAAALSEEARIEADRALALDPTAANAHVALALRIDPAVTLAERERHFRRAIALSPGLLRARVGYAMLLRRVGRLYAASDAWRSVEFANDPRAVNVTPQFAFLYAMLGNLDEAYETIDRLQAVKPDWARGVRATVKLWWDDLGNVDAALIRQLPGGADGCVEAHVATLKRTTRAPVRGLPPQCDRASVDWKIRMLARQGDIDGAYAMFPEALPNSRSQTMFLFYPEMKGFRADPRFAALAERLGLTSYWRETNEWPDACKEDGAPAWCPTTRADARND